MIMDDLTEWIGVMIGCVVLMGTGTACSTIPDTPEAQFRAGVKAKQKGQDEYAIEYWKRTLDHDPTNVPALVNLGTTYLERKEADQAITYFNRALDVKSDFPEVLARKGKAQLEKEAYQKAVSSLTEALEYRDKYQYALLNRGKAYVKLKEFDRARQDFLKSLEITQNPGAYFGLGHIHVEKRQWEQALEQFTKAIKADSEYKPAYLYRAAVHREMGYQEKKKEDLERYLTLSNPDVSRASIQKRIQVLTQRNQDEN